MYWGVLGGRSFRRLQKPSALFASRSGGVERKRGRPIASNRVSAFARSGILQMQKLSFKEVDSKSFICVRTHCFA